MVLDSIEGETGLAWTRAEIEAAVASYFQMLRLQELGQALNKAEHNRRLQALLPARSRGAIEFKHANISAVLMEIYDTPALRGYLPRSNYQSDLVGAVGRALAADRVLDEAALCNVQRPAEPPLLADFDDFVVAPPARPARKVRDAGPAWATPPPIKRNYLQREAHNRSLGLAGELLIMQYEARRLHALGARSLVDRIEHVSCDRGDGTGYDILSFESDGRERFIEVKTTSYLAETPFFISPNEVDFSAAHPAEFHLYRLFNFRHAPRMFVLPGAVAARCRLDPVSFRASVLAG